MKNWPRWYSFPVEPGKQWSRRPAGRTGSFCFHAGLFNSPKWIVQLGSTKRNPCFAVGARRKWPLDFRRGGCRLRRCTPSDEPSWNKKRSVRCCSANRNCKSRLRRSSGGWLLVSGSLRRAGSIKGCTAGQVEKLRWDAELRGPCKICGADFV